MIHLSFDGGSDATSASVATLTIDRAERRNALSTDLWRSLLAYCERSEVRTARALVLRGQPGVFCAGADIDELQTLLADPAALAENNRIVSAAQRALAALPLPTLAVIDGPCFGGGFGLAAACDFRIGSDRSSFAVTPARLGLLYSLEDTASLLRLVGDARARRLLLGGERLDAAAALAWGVLDAVVPPDRLGALAAERAALLASQSRTSMAGIKATLACLCTRPGPNEAAVRAAFDAAFTGADLAEGAAAFLSKRAPRFE